MQKALKTRLQQLNELKTSCTQRTIYASFGDRQGRTEEPTYDIKQVDKKIVSINSAMFHMDAAIKAKNAEVKIDIDIDYDQLASEIS
jgi:hypothetical protein